MKEKSLYHLTNKKFDFQCKRGRQINCIYLDVILPEVQQHLSSKIQNMTTKLKNKKFANYNTIYKRLYVEGMLFVQMMASIRLTFCPLIFLSSFDPLSRMCKLCSIKIVIFLVVCRYTNPLKKMEFCFKQKK